jgi:YidC/Oxa1 family membrane protein insertase
MDNIRLILIIALFFILMMLYQAWQQDYGPKSSPPIASTSSRPTPNTSPPGDVTATPSTYDEVPKLRELTKSTTEVPTTPESQGLTSNSRITVETDLFKIEIDTQGGDIRQAFLRKYPVTVEKPDEPFQLMNDQLDNLFVAQTGLLPPSQAPTHQTVYQAEQSYYRLNDNASTLTVKLHWQSEQGIEVDKIYTFHRDSYAIAVKHLVRNNSSQPWEGHLYAQFQRSQPLQKGNAFIYTYLGGAISSPKSLYEKISFDSIRDGSFTKENRPGWANGWAAMIQHYFLAAWIPQPEPIYHYYTKLLTQGNRYLLGLYGPSQIVAPNAQQSFDLTLYIGPKSQHQLAALSPGLDLTVDYGWLWFIAQPLFWGLEWIHQWVGNWGWAIIIITLLIKLAFFQLSAASYKSMAKMRRLQPRLTALKERYSDNREAFSRAMMELYKQERINPLGGCLPILVQIPVFIALYWVLLESVELRQAHFIFWLNDLSSPDPFFVLPVIMGITMLLQHYLNPAAIDPVQQKVMMILPFVFTVFFAFFPSGLVLYWVVNNILSIAQQWVITKKIVGQIT